MSGSFGPHRLPLGRSLSAQDYSSSNVRLVCQKCNSSDWAIPKHEMAGRCRTWNSAAELPD